MNVARAIVDQDEIVSRAVHFCETQHPFSSSIVCHESQLAHCSRRPLGDAIDRRRLNISVALPTGKRLQPLPDCVLTFTYSVVKRRATWVSLVILGLTMRASFAGDYNGLILEQIKQMPQGGHYSVSRFAKIRLQSSAHFERSEEHTSELQSRRDLVCRLLLEKKKKIFQMPKITSGNTNKNKAN